MAPQGTSTPRGSGVSGLEDVGSMTPLVPFAEGEEEEEEEEVGGE